MPADGFEILEKFERIAPLLDDVRRAADANRDALGFFGKGVYEEFARKGSLLVLTHRGSYAGHLLFWCRYPKTNVLQMFIAADYRQRGKAAALLRRLKEMLTEQGFGSIYARVAEDLEEANRFWEHQGFYVQRFERGGSVRDRQILVRCHELPSPQLFPPSGISSANPLGFSSSTTAEVPLFLLDLNVLFDVMPRRLRHSDAVAIFHAERMNSCRLAISDEIRHELRRTASTGRTDPMEAYIATFPSFPLNTGTEADELVAELRDLVFADRELSNNDWSDLRHLATAIRHDLAGFITSDEAILSQAVALREKYALEVISPSAFSAQGATPRSNVQFDMAGAATLRVALVTANEEARIRTFLSKLGLSGSTIAAWCPNENAGLSRVAVWADDQVLAYAAWGTPSPATDVTQIRLAVQENDAQAATAGRIVLKVLFETLATDGPRRLALTLPAHQGLIRELAISEGFRSVAEQTELAKLLLGRVVTPSGWQSFRELMRTKGGLGLPAAMPVFRNVDQHIAVHTPDGNQTHVGLDYLETLLGPGLLCLPGRPAVITPIQRRFSEPLLGHPRQAQLLPKGSAATYEDRHYLSAPQTLSRFKRGTLILFYESTRNGGRGEVTAIARVRQAYLRIASELAEVLEQSVLTEGTLAEIGKLEMKTVTVFDSSFHLPKPVPLASLRRLGCGRPNDLITTHSITDTQLDGILKEAFDG